MSNEQLVPGTVRNGYVLTSDYQWIPVPPHDAEPARSIARPQRVVMVKPINHLKEITWTVLTCGLYGFVYAWKVFYRRFDR